MKGSIVLLVISICLLYTFTAEATQKSVSSASVMNDSKTGKILSDLRTKFLGLKTYKINFNFEYVDQQDKKKENTQGVYTAQGEKFSLITAEREVFCDGKTVWTLSVKDKELQIANYKGKNKFTSPITMVQNFEKEYFYHFKEEETPQKNQRVIELTPIDKKKPIFKIDLIVDIAKKTILYSKIYEKSGIRQIFKISQLIENPAVSENDFVCNPAKYSKDIEVVDLR
jgi:outer membrane lipoprotein-sorting protein